MQMAASTPCESTFLLFVLFFLTVFSIFIVMARPYTFSLVDKFMLPCFIVHPDSCG
uniref:Uncharacterized protein n=1 Tax=Rhizophora mucronata TaxID=61149 RepID=A0A2P2NYD2_RHIMU